MKQEVYKNAQNSNVAWLSNEDKLNEIDMSIIETYFNVAIKLIIVSSYLSYLAQFKYVVAKLPLDSEWENELREMDYAFDRLYKESFREASNMTSTLKNRIETELLALSETLGTDNNTSVEIEKVLSMMREDVKRGNRLTLTSLQALQQRVSALADEATNVSKGVVLSLAATFKRDIKKVTDLLIEVFDLLDLVKSNAIHHEGDDWIGEMLEVVDMGLDLLADYGIEEIPVTHQPFDGRLMEGIGTVSLAEVGDTFEQYDVYTVYQRGFWYEDSQTLIRRAKVITVY